MAKTYQDVITEARVLLSDTDVSDPRYSDTNLLAILNRAMNSLARIRPDAFYSFFSANSLNVPQIVASGATAGQANLADTFGLENQFFNPLVEYVTGMAEVVDDEYTEDGRAAMLLNNFKTSVVGI